jgi:hypothetical protein
MSNLIILAILIALLVIVLMQLFKKSKPSSAQNPPQDLANLKINEARTGDVISVAGAGDDLNDLDFTADRVTRYESGAHPWTEMSGSYREHRVAVRVAGDEELEVHLHNDARKLSLEELGLAEEDLAAMDERQNTADSFEWDEKVWLYRRSREVKGWRTGQSQPAAFYYWEFQEQDGKRLLEIRKSEAEPFAVIVYTGIPAGDISVYRPGGLPS